MPIRSALLAACAALLLATAALHAAAGPSDGDNAEPMLDVRIGLPDPGQFKRVCDEKDWRNPLIDLTADGRVLLRSTSHPTFRAIDPADLRRAVAELPVSDWPYGRIIAIPNRAHTDANDTAACIPAVLASVNSLRMSWWGWPHGCGTSAAGGR